MIKITAAVRNSVREIVAKSREYDAATIRISRDGSVSALRDADKTFAGIDPMRYLVGHVDDMVAANGSIREGW